MATNIQAIETDQNIPFSLALTCNIVAMSALETLRERLKEISNLNAAAAVLSWDQQCYMPHGAGESRAEQMTTLSTLIHEKSTSDEIGSLIDKAIAETSGMDRESTDASLIRVAKRDYELAVKVPTELVAEETKTTTLAHEEWVKARKENNYNHFRPWLEKIVDIERRIAEHRGYKDQIYDALLDPYEPGMTSAEVERIFNDVRADLVKLVKEIKESSVKVDDSILYRKYEVSKQNEICNDVVSKIGYSFDTGRQDRAAHPFCTSFATSDVRITTRFDEHSLLGSVMSSMHEAGHAMYEQGFPKEFDGTPLRGGCSLGFHESQSRLWENQVGRGRPFINWYFPKLQSTFPDSLGDVSSEQFFMAVNKVEPSLIRTESDEVTYNLHIMLRFELEKEMVAGKIDFAHLPEIWNEKMREYLGVVPDSDANGVLQDVHWSAGILGYFPTYALGNLIAAQLWKKVRTDIPDLEEQLGRGEFQNLLSWLRKNVHVHGCKFFPGELIQKITGGPIDSTIYNEYLRDKFGKIYQLGS